MPEDRVTTYQFTFGDGTTREFNIKLRQPALGLVSKPPNEEPEWTALTFHQCPNCPLSVDEHPRCPVARNLVPVSDAFCDRVSFDEVDIVVQTEARSYGKRCALQEAASSLMGLIMATSGCPHLDKLRPMVYTHLPFSTAEQTTYRAVSMYLLAQFFRQRHGHAPDWELRDLSRAYEDIRIVNKAFARRLAQIQKKDANLNAIVKLDNQAGMAWFSITEQQWEDLEHIFRPYFTDESSGPVCQQSAAKISTGHGL